RDLAGLSAADKPLTQRLLELTAFTCRLQPCEPHGSLFSNHPPPARIYTLSLHDALPISVSEVTELQNEYFDYAKAVIDMYTALRSEEHTSELQSRENLVCRLLLEKNKSKARPGHSVES